MVVSFSGVNPVSLSTCTVRQGRARAVIDPVKNRVNDRADAWRIDLFQAPDCIPRAEQETTASQQEREVVLPSGGPDRLCSPVTLRGVCVNGIAKADLATRRR
jgi:hypothetical protein